MGLGLLIVGMLVGLIAAGTALALGLPLWVAVLIYSVAGSAGLVLAAALALWVGARLPAQSAPETRIARPVLRATFPSS